MKKKKLLLLVLLFVIASLVLYGCQKEENLDGSDGKVAVLSGDEKPAVEEEKLSKTDQEKEDFKEIERVVFEWFSLLNKGDAESQFKAAKLCFVFEEFLENNVMTKDDLIYWSLVYRSQGYTEKIEEGIENHQLEDIKVSEISFRGEGKVRESLYEKIGGPRTYDRAAIVDVRIDLKDGSWFEETVRLVHYKGEWKIDF